MGILKNIFKKLTPQAVSDDKPVEKPAETRQGALPQSNEGPTVQKKPITATAKKAMIVKVNKKVDHNAFKIISKPLITEKATDLASLNKYCFIVPNEVNKSEVIKTIINVYGVKPVRVNFIKRRGKNVHYGRNYGVTKKVKKAIVTLNSADKIELYEGV